MKWRYWVERPPASFDVRDEIIFENASFSPSDRVLEVGVGLAGTTYKLASQVAQVTAADVSRELIQYLTARKRIPNIEFVPVDVSAPEAREVLRGPFDAVVSEDTLEHVEKPPGFFRSIADVLKPGGTFVFTFPNERAPSHGITRFSTRSELAELIRASGFSTVELYCVELRRHARLIESVFADLPIRVLRAVRHNPDHDPQVFHETWSFGARHKLERFRVLIHAYWGFVRGLMKAARPIYRKTPAEEEILDRRLLVFAKR